ncbi:hydrogenase small subunit [Thiothrix nivea]|uniref:hydrogenase (acceptor) n=1 Tax=Thiothrix nivea (strain ATCC 35100 / DSM 5205 / JP2) TaxID=870187 RepID=A0A656HG90_THINJ|nr:hydrogenase small subunit [Thiothrix nivea]EIJ36041.1 hydrogenase (NiFe) small subunit HydA [Thiothrix nivea DSM 5205]
MESAGVAAYVSRKKVTRRAFLKYCALMAAVLALPPSAIPAMVEKLQQGLRPAVIWLSFQECTGCTESLTRSYAPSIEALMFDYLSLDYHHTLQAAAGEAAEAARLETMRKFAGQYLLIVDGSIPAADNGVYSTMAGRTNLDVLRECAAEAAVIIAVGSCAAFGGLAAAAPNPTGAKSVEALMAEGRISRKPLVNLPGCPPLPLAISGVLAHFLTFGRLPDLDDLKRPLSIYGNTVHDRCSRYRYYQDEKFAEHFGDEGHRKGWCLYKLGCKGPVTHNACFIHKWNQGTSSPVEAGHPCLGCSEPGFWDKGGFYRSLDAEAISYSPVAESPDEAIEAGRQLYEDNCIYCHSADPTGFKTVPDKVPEVLRAGTVRAHRSFQFSDDQLDILGKYLNSQQ